ncbi:hypothetical protein B0H11DRAFT_2274385 [Mycena galericulata]|nr:hypothetical protein B0H11DRAFT_2274385 [Mycena galericulata]
MDAKLRVFGLEDAPFVVPDFRACFPSFGVSQHETVAAHSTSLTLKAAPSSNSRERYLICYRAIRKYNRAQFFDGVRQEDGTAASLGAIDARRCVLGREKLLQTQWALGNTMEWLKSRHDDGCTVPRCGSWRDRQMNIALISGKLGAFLPPSALADVGLCAACLRRAVQSISAGRKKMWDELPSFFDLPPWSELRNNK